MKIKSDILEYIPDSCTVDIDKQLVSYSINIPPEISRYLSPQNVHKTKYHSVYRIQKHPLTFTAQNILKIYNLLMVRAMMNVRKAKVEHMSKRIIQLNVKATQLKLNL